MTWPRRPNPYSRPKGFRAWLNNLPRLDPEVPLMWGFNNEREFYICFLPCILVSVIGLITLHLMLIIYGICWFFGCYAFFVLLDTFRDDSKDPSMSDMKDKLDKIDDKDIEKFLGSDRGDRFKNGLHKASGGTRWAIIGFGIMALLALFGYFSENPEYLKGPVGPSGY